MLPAVSVEALSVDEHELEGRDQDIGALLDRLGGSISGKPSPIRGSVKVLPSLAIYRP